MPQMLLVAPCHAQPSRTLPCGSAPVKSAGVNHRSQQKAVPRRFVTRRTAKSCRLYTLPCFNQIINFHKAVGRRSGGT